MGTESDLFSAGKRVAKKGNSWVIPLPLLRGSKTTRRLRNAHLISSTAICLEGLTP